VWFVWARASACSVCAAAWLGREIHPAACCRSSAELGLRLVVEAATDPKPSTLFPKRALSPTWQAATDGARNADAGEILMCLFVTSLAVGIESARG